MTIPPEIAREAHINEGDILEVKMVGNGVVFEKASDELPILRIGRRISKREIEQTIAESAEEVSSLSGTGLIQHVRGGKMQRKSVIC